jgi:hypothetical protein
MVLKLSNLNLKTFGPCGKIALFLAQLYHFTAISGISYSALKVHRVSGRDLNPLYRRDRALFKTLSLHISVVTQILIFVKMETLHTNLISIVLLMSQKQNLRYKSLLSRYSN